MDTAQDPRLRVAEQALGTLESIFQHGLLKAQFPRRRCEDACGKARSALMSLKYSYADAETMRGMPQFQQVLDAADTIEEHLGGSAWWERITEDELAVARTRWGLELLRGLPERLDLQGEGLELGVDAGVGRVVSTREHPAADALLVTKVNAGRGRTIATNDLSVEPDDAVAVARLQPVEIRGVVSEGMFLGVPEEGVLRDVGEDADGRPDVVDDAWKETRGIISEYLA